MTAVLLQPALIPVGGLDEFQNSQHTFLASVSPRGNGVVAHASSVSNLRSCVFNNMLILVNIRKRLKCRQRSDTRRTPCYILHPGITYQSQPWRSVYSIYVIFDSKGSSSFTATRTSPLRPSKTSQNPCRMILPPNCTCITSLLRPSTNF